MEILKFRMYASLVIGALSILIGLYLFVIHADKTVSHFLITCGIISVIIALIIFLGISRRRKMRS